MGRDSADRIKRRWPDFHAAIAQKNERLNPTDHNSVVASKDGLLFTALKEIYQNDADALQAAITRYRNVYQEGKLTFIFDESDLYFSLSNSAEFRFRTKPCLTGEENNFSAVNQSVTDLIQAWQQDTDSYDDVMPNVTREPVRLISLPLSVTNLEQPSDWRTIEHYIQAHRYLVCFFIDSNLLAEATREFYKMTSNPKPGDILYFMDDRFDKFTSIQQATTPQMAQQRGQQGGLTTVELRAWEMLKFKCMEYAVTKKFESNPKLYELLKFAEDRILIAENSEGNNSRKQMHTASTSVSASSSSSFSSSIASTKKLYESSEQGNYLGIILMKLAERQRLSSSNVPVKQDLLPLVSQQFIDSVPLAKFDRGNINTGCSLHGASDFRIPFFSSTPKDLWFGWTTGSGIDAKTKHSPVELLLIARHDLTAARKIAQAQTNYLLAWSLNASNKTTVPKPFGVELPITQPGQYIPYDTNASAMAQAEVNSSTLVTIDSRDILGFAPTGTRTKGGKDEVDRQHYCLVISPQTELAPSHGAGLQSHANEVALRSNYLAVMDPVKIHMSKNVNSKTANALYGAINVFRGSEQQGFPFQEPRSLRLIIMPPVNCIQDTIDPESSAYFNLTKQKLRHCLRIVRDDDKYQDIKNIVFSIEEFINTGATAEVVALCFWEVLQEPEFQNALESIVIRIPSVDPANNLTHKVFNTVFNKNNNELMKVVLPNERKRLLEQIKSKAKGESSSSASTAEQSGSVNSNPEPSSVALMSPELAAIKVTAIIIENNPISKALWEEVYEGYFSGIEYAFTSAKQQNNVSQANEVLGIYKEMVDQFRDAENCYREAYRLKKPPFVFTQGDRYFDHLSNFASISFCARPSITGEVCEQSNLHFDFKSAVKEGFAALNNSYYWNSVEHYLLAHQLLVCFLMAPLDITAATHEFYNMGQQVIPKESDINAFKQQRIELFNKINAADTPHDAQRLASQGELTSLEKLRWNELKFQCMRRAVIRKFEHNKGNEKLLLLIAELREQVCPESDDNETKAKSVVTGESSYSSSSQSSLLRVKSLELGIILMTIAETHWMQSVTQESEQLPVQSNDDDDDNDASIQTQTPAKSLRDQNDEDDEHDTKAKLRSSDLRSSAPAQDQQWTPAKPKVLQSSAAPQLQSSSSTTNGTITKLGFSSVPNYTPH